jgi:hypothetical protein
MMCLLQGYGKLSLLVALEDFVEGDGTFEGAAQRSVGDGKQRPAAEVWKRGGEGEIGEEYGSALGAEALLECVGSIRGGGGDVCVMIVGVGDRDYSHLRR